MVAFSYSGETDELLAILPAVLRIGIPIIAFTGRPGSTLGRAARVVLDVCVDKEACPMNLAPTTSTTVMLAVSDAVAMAVMMARDFSQRDYAALHPAGTLGRRLLLRVSDVMRTGDALAIVREDAPLREALFAITNAHAGAAIVTDANHVVTGIVTDGDARRKLLADLDYWNRPVRESMNTTFGTVPPEMLAAESLNRLEAFHPDPGARVGEAPVTDEQGRPLGMLMLKDLVKAGIA
jgi:arabinose-5-phosphate isomerase